MQQLICCRCYSYYHFPTGCTRACTFSAYALAIVRVSYTFLGCWLAVVELVMATLPPSILHARDQLSADFDWLCVPHDMLILDDLCSTS